MNYRDWLQQLIYKIINPVVHGMIKVGITPNFITTTGLVMNIVAACVFVYAGVYKPGEPAYVGWGGGIVLFAGLFDMMDGRVARVGNMSSTFGALYDSVLDRYSEMVTLFGIFYYLILQGYLWGSMITFVALIGSLMVSYVRARAEGLGLECRSRFHATPRACGADQSWRFVLRYFRRLQGIRPHVDTDCSDGCDSCSCQFDGICAYCALP